LNREYHCKLCFANRLLPFLDLGLRDCFITLKRNHVSDTCQRNPKSPSLEKLDSSCFEFVPTNRNRSFRWFVWEAKGKEMECVKICVHYFHLNNDYLVWFDVFSFEFSRWIQGNWLLYFPFFMMCADVSLQGFPPPFHSKQKSETTPTNLSIYIGSEFLILGSPRCCLLLYYGSKGCNIINGSLAYIYSTGLC